MISIGVCLSANPVGTTPRETYTIYEDDVDKALGTVTWHVRWHRYVFQPEYSKVFAAECLRDLADFVGNCNRAQKVVEG